MDYKLHNLIGTPSLPTPAVSQELWVTYYYGPILTALSLIL